MYHLRHAQARLPGAASAQKYVPTEANSVRFASVGTGNDLAEKDRILCKWAFSWGLLYGEEPTEAKTPWEGG
jgi:hypothetical protein